MINIENRIDKLLVSLFLFKMADIQKENIGDQIKEKSKNDNKKKSKFDEPEMV